MIHSLADVELNGQPGGSRWLQWLGVVIIGLLLVGAGAWVWLGNRGVPRLVVNPTSYDFGQVPADRASETSFTVINAGTASLTIESITTSCGCTKATISSQTIPPGGSAQLDVTFDPQVHPDTTGPMFRLVYLASNDPAQPEAQIELRMDVVTTTVRFDAGYHEIKPGEEVLRVVWLLANDPHTPVAEARLTATIQ